MKVQARFQRAKFPEDSRFASFNVGATDFKLQGDKKTATALAKTTTNSANPMIMNGLRLAANLSEMCKSIFFDHLHRKKICGYPRIGWTNCKLLGVAIGEMVAKNVPDPNYKPEPEGLAEKKQAPCRSRMP